MQDKIEWHVIKHFIVVSRSAEDYLHIFGIVLRNKRTADRMYRHFVKHSNVYDNEELKMRKDDIVRLYTHLDDVYDDLFEFTLKTKDHNFLSDYRRDLLIVLDKIVAYEHASSAFYQDKIERWIYECIGIINVHFVWDLHLFFNFLRNSWSTRLFEMKWKDCVI